VVVPVDRLRGHVRPLLAGLMDPTPPPSAADAPPPFRPRGTGVLLALDCPPQ
jgi:hypothetical protein